MLVSTRKHFRVIGGYVNPCDNFICQTPSHKLLGSLVRYPVKVISMTGLYTYRFTKQLMHRLFNCLGTGIHDTGERVHFHDRVCTAFG